MFIILEVGFRVYLNWIESKQDTIVKKIKDKTLGYRLEPGFKGKYKINSYGFRDYEYSENKPDNTLRIVNIGDSLTFGLGLKLESVYSKVMEKKMNCTLNTHKNYEVLNLGIFGYNTIQEYYLLKNEGLRFQPDIILLGFYYNDSDLAKSLEKNGLLEKSNEDRSWTDVSLRDWLKKSKLLLFVKTSILRDILHTNLNSIPSYMNARVHETNWGTMKEYLNKMKLLCKTNDIDFVIVNFPSQFQLDFHESDWLIQKDISNFCLKESIPFLDLTPFFVAQKEKELFVDEDSHPSRIGSQIASDAIFDFLFKSQLKQINDNLGTRGQNL